MTARYSGVVSFWNPANDFGEITTEGHAPLAVTGADLRRCGATELGTRVMFEQGVLVSGISGAVNVERVGA